MHLYCWLAHDPGLSAPAWPRGVPVAVRGARARQYAAINASEGFIWGTGFS
jgi:hypothetical protein